MTISLGGAPGPETGGQTQIGGQAVQAPPPPEPVKPVEAPPAPTAPAMTLPNPRAPRPRPQPKPAQAPPDASRKHANTGERAARGHHARRYARARDRVRAQQRRRERRCGDAGRDRLLLQRVSRPDGGRQSGATGIRARESSGSTTMKFTILRNGDDPGAAGREIERIRRARQRGDARAAVVAGSLRCRGVREPDADRASPIRLSAVIMNRHLMTWRVGAVVAARPRRSSLARRRCRSGPAGATAVGSRGRDQRRSRHTAALRGSRFRCAHT